MWPRFPDTTASCLAHDRCATRCARRGRASPAAQGRRGAGPACCATAGRVARPCISSLRCPRVCAVRPDCRAQRCDLPWSALWSGSWRPWSDAVPERDHRPDQRPSSSWIRCATSAGLRTHAVLAGFLPWRRISGLAAQGAYLLWSGLWPVTPPARVRDPWYLCDGGRVGMPWCWAVVATTIGCRGPRPPRCPGRDLLVGLFRRGVGSGCDQRVVVGGGGERAGGGGVLAGGQGVGGRSALPRSRLALMPGRVRLNTPVRFGLLQRRRTPRRLTPVERPPGRCGCSCGT